MFNFLVTGEKNAWDFPAYEFPDLGRFTEHTQPDIRDKFPVLDDDTIKELKKLPALFTYESDNQPAKVGYLTRVMLRSTSFLVEYEFETKIPEFPFLG